MASEEVSDLSADDDEVFFGPISAKEASKFSRRKTVVFTPNFREDRRLMSARMSSLGVIREQLDDVDSSKENLPPTTCRETVAPNTDSHNSMALLEYQSPRKILHLPSEVVIPLFILN
jgi:hypothetical protein